MTDAAAIQQRNIVKKRFICDYCTRSFPKPSALKIHIYTHTGEKPYSCDKPGCNKAFSCASNLRRHLKTHNRMRSNHKKVEGISTVVRPIAYNLTPRTPETHGVQGSHAVLDYLADVSFLSLMPSGPYQELTPWSWCQSAIKQYDTQIVPAALPKALPMPLCLDLLMGSADTLSHIPTNHYDMVPKETSTDTAYGL